MSKLRDDNQLCTLRARATAIVTASECRGNDIGSELRRANALVVLLCMEGPIRLVQRSCNSVGLRAKRTCRNYAGALGVATLA